MHVYLGVLRASSGAEMRIYLAFRLAPAPTSSHSSGPCHEDPRGFDGSAMVSHVLGRLEVHTSTRQTLIVPVY